MRAKLEENELPSIEPYLRGFDGSLSFGNSDGKYITEGIITSPSKSSVAISEVPIDTRSNNFNVREIEV